MSEKKYIDAMNAIEISPEAKRRILAKSIQTKHDKENKIMRPRIKIATIAVAATLLMGITVFAATGIIQNWFSSSSSIPDYKALPTAEEVVKDIGYTPVLIESFENGYIFENGSILTNDLQDDSDNSVEKFKSVVFRYVKSGDEVMMSQEKYSSEMEQDGTLISSDSGYDIYFSSYTNKVVPPNYILTEEDKKAEENGEIIFSYGSDDVYLSEVQGVFWSMDEMHFSLTQIDGKLSADELVEMAEYVIAESK